MTSGKAGDDQGEGLEGLLSLPMREALTLAPTVLHTVRIPGNPLRRPAPASPTRVATRILTGAEADFRLLELVGTGGMGVVYEAVQTSMDRSVAVKRANPGEVADAEGAQAFLREAELTGKLEHPNIIPVHEVGQDESGHLFYVMKLVEGRPWSSLLKEHALEVNLGLLARVMEAMAFAHARGVVHRDLKPENVMLGPFGEVYVVDWGMAARIPTGAEGAEAPLYFGGTPAYMAPEAATTEAPTTVPAVDIYLLGAILFEILTGLPPHPGQTPTACFMNASRNVIRPHAVQGELMDLALRAMSTRPEDRPGSVQALQLALQDYKSHVQSHALVTLAEAAARDAALRGDHAQFQGALFGFREALRLWPGNAKAGEGLSATTRAYAAAACDQGDLELAASLLDPADPSHADLGARVDLERRERRERATRLRLLSRGTYALVASLLVILTASTLLVRRQQRRAEAASLAEARQRREAEGALYRLGLSQALLLGTNGKSREAEDLLATLPVEPRGWEFAFLRRRLQGLIAQPAGLFPGQGGRVYALALSPVGPWAASGGSDEKVRLWDTSNLQELRVLAGGEGWKGGDALAFSPEGRLLALGDGTARWADGSGLAFTFAGPQEEFTCLAFSPDGRLLAGSDWNGHLRLWETTRGQLQARLRDAHGPVTRLAFSPDGTALVWGSKNGAIQTVEVRPGARPGLGPPRPLGGLGAPVMAVAWSRQGRIAAGARDGSVRVWDSAGGAARAFTHPGSGVPSLAFSPDGRWLAGGAIDGVVPVWEVSSGRRALDLKGHQGLVIPVAFGADGRLATGSHDGAVRLWRMPNGDQGPEEAWALGAQALCHLERDRLVVGGPDGTLALWNARRGATEWKVRLPPGEAQVLAAGSGLLFSAGKAGVIRALDAGTGRERQVLARTGTEQLALAVARDLLATGAKEATVRVWEASTGKVVRALTGLEDWAGALAFSPGGGLLAAATVRGGVRVWETRDWREVFNLAGGEGRYMKPVSVAFSPSGDRLALEGWDKGIALWDTRTWRSLPPLLGQTGWGLGAWTPDGRYLSASLDGALRVWDPWTGTLLLDLPLPGGPPAALTLAPDGRALALACGKLLRWEVE